MFNENDLESVYVVGQEITDRNLGETEESDQQGSQHSRHG